MLFPRNANNHRIRTWGAGMLGQWALDSRYRGDDDGGPRWRALPSHPGASRWAPGSFAMRGTARAYFTGGYDRTTGVLRSDVWGMDLSPLFRAGNHLSPTSFAPSIPPTSAPSAVPPTAETEEVPSAGPTTARTIPASEEQVNDAGDAEHDLIACIARDECDESRSELGIDKFFVGTYPTKGCFAKLLERQGLSGGIVERRPARRTGEDLVRRLLFGRLRWWRGRRFELSTGKRYCEFCHGRRKLLKGRIISRRNCLCECHGHIVGFCNNVINE